MLTPSLGLRADAKLATRDRGLRRGGVRVAEGGLPAERMGERLPDVDAPGAMRLRPRQEESEFGRRLPGATPRFLLLHTLAHLLIRGAGCSVRATGRRSSARADL